MGEDAVYYVASLTFRTWYALEQTSGREHGGSMDAKHGRMALRAKEFSGLDTLDGCIHDYLVEVSVNWFKA